jgi:hypothetical protein
LNLQLQDFSPNEITQYLHTLQPQFPPTQTFTRLLRDVSTSPLDLHILLSLISTHCLSKHQSLDDQTALSEEFDEYVRQLYDKRVEIATLSHELMIEKINESEQLNVRVHSATSKGTSSLSGSGSGERARDQQNLRVLLTSVMSPIVTLPTENLPLSNFKDSLFSDSQLRRTSLFMETQIALCSLPDHVQAKFILLVVLPKQQPATSAFLSSLWQCSLRIVEDTLFALVSVDLIKILPSQSPSSLAQHPSRLLLVTLHATHFDYLDSLIHYSTIWRTRIEVAVERTARYLTHPSCIITSEGRRYTNQELENLSSQSLDQYFFPISLSSPESCVRLSAYWRRVSSSLSLLFPPLFFLTSRLFLLSSLHCMCHAVMTHRLQRWICFLSLVMSSTILSSLYATSLSW